MVFSGIPLVRFVRGCTKTSFLPTPHYLRPHRNSDNPHNSERTPQSGLTSSSVCHGVLGVDDVLMSSKSVSLHSRGSASGVEKITFKCYVHLLIFRHLPCELLV